jgi:hypothetical protein
MGHMRLLVAPETLDREYSRVTAAVWHGLICDMRNGGVVLERRNVRDRAAGLGTHGCW